MIILASQSPRRRELMKYITTDFVAVSADADETLPSGMSPQEAVLRLSALKAAPFANEKDIVIGADTVVAADGKILGKPQDEQEAKEMLRLLSGKTHSVFTGVTVLCGGKKEAFFTETRVTFFPLTEQEIEKYVRTKEPLDKAGAYGIQGFGSLLVERIDGDYFNVVGLPVSRLCRILSKFQ